MIKKMILVFVLLTASVFGKTFSRSTIAYLNDVTYSVDEPRLQTIFIPSESDGEMLTGEGVAGANIYPQQVYNNKIYGTGSDGCLYDSFDGETWTRINSAQVFHIVRILDNGNMIIIQNATPKSLVYTSSDLGVSLSEAIDFGADASATIIDWGVASNGATVLISEYAKTPANTLGGRYVYRSADSGATWATVIDANDYVAINHWHLVTRHNATGRWLAYAGDGWARDLCVYSDDDGVSWQIIDANNTPIGATYFQPVSAFDDGDPNIMYFAIDSYGVAGWQNVLTGEYGTFGDILSYQRNSMAYAWSLTKRNGVWYLGGYQHGAFDRNPCIWVSNDAVNWTVYHQFTAGDEAINGTFWYAGFIGGKMHYKTNSTTFGHFAVSPATITEKIGHVIMPATTNLYSTANNSSFDSTAGDWAVVTAGLTRTRITDANAYDGASLKIYKNDDVAGDLAFKGPSVIPTAGQAYGFRFKAKSIPPVRLYVYYQQKFNDAWSFIGDIQFFTLDDEWREYTSFPVTAVSGQYDYFHSYFVIQKGTKPFEMFMDRPQFISQPSRLWTLGTTSAAADRLHRTVTTSGWWSDTFYVKPLSSSLIYTGSPNLYLVTYKIDEDNYASLYYDSSDSTFKLQRTVAGVTQTAVSSAAVYWSERSVFKITIDSGGSWLSANIDIGGKCQTITDKAFPLQGKEITIIAGDTNYSNQFPATYVFDDIVVNTANVANGINSVAGTKSGIGIADIVESGDIDAEVYFMAVQEVDYITPSTGLADANFAIAYRIRGSGGDATAGVTITEIGSGLYAVTFVDANLITLTDCNFATLILTFTPDDGITATSILSIDVHRIDSAYINSSLDTLLAGVADSNSFMDDWFTTLAQQITDGNETIYAAVVDSNGVQMQYNVDVNEFNAYWFDYINSHITSVHADINSKIEDINAVSNIGNSIYK